MEPMEPNLTAGDFEHEVRMILQHAPADLELGPVDVLRDAETGTVFAVATDDAIFGTRDNATWRWMQLSGGDVAVTAWRDGVELGEALEPGALS